MTKKQSIDKLSDTLLCNLEQTARIARVQAFRFFEETKDIEVSFNEYIIIEALFLNPKIHQRDLAKFLYKGTANLSRDLEKLEAKKIIKRTIDTKDKRIVKTLELTSKGEKIYSQASEKALEHINQMECIFNEKEYIEFLGYIKRLRAKLTEACEMIFD